MKKLEFFIKIENEHITKIVEVKDNITYDEIYEKFDKWFDEQIIDAGWNYIKGDKVIRG